MNLKAQAFRARILRRFGGRILSDCEGLRPSIGHPIGHPIGQIVRLGRPIGQPIGHLSDWLSDSGGQSDNLSDWSPDRGPQSDNLPGKLGLPDTVFRNKTEGIFSHRGSVLVFFHPPGPHLPCSYTFVFGHGLVGLGPLRVELGPGWGCLPCSYTVGFGPNHQPQQVHLVCQFSMDFFLLCFTDRICYAIWGGRTSGM